MSGLRAGSRVRTSAGKTGIVTRITTDEGEHVAWVAFDEPVSNPALAHADARESMALNRWPFAAADLSVIDAVSNHWDGFTTAQLKTLASWAYDAEQTRELNVEELRRDLRGEIDRRQARDFGEVVLSETDDERSHELSELWLRRTPQNRGG